MYVCVYACVATGHVKIADFGGARPLSDRARVEVEQSRGLLKALRSGDWRDTATSSNTTTTMDAVVAAGESHSVIRGGHLMDEEEKEEALYDKEYDCQEEEEVEEEENRLEGTPGYMAPEVSMLHSSLAFASLALYWSLDMYAGSGGRVHHPT